MAKGKWDHLIGVLPPLPEKYKEETDEEGNEIPGTAEKHKMRVLMKRQELVELYAKDNRGAVLTASVLADMYKAARQAREETKQADKNAKVLIDAIDGLLKEAYEGENTKKLELRTGGAVATQVQPKAQIMDAEECRRWCIEQGLEKQMKLPWGTINSMTKERLEAGDPEPPGVKAFLQTIVKLYKK